MDIINDPHDALFKSTFGQISMARDFLKSYLPEDLLGIINLDSLIHEDNSFLDNELQEQFADLVYKAEIHGQEAYISFLFEHKSYRDRMVIFQLLKYIISIWENKIKDDMEKARTVDKKLKTDDILIPMVIPIVVYHNKYDWNIKMSLGEMMLGFMGLSTDVRKYIPNFEYILADITKLQGKNLNEEFLLVLDTLSKVRYVSKEEVTDIFKRAIKLYVTSKDRDMVEYFVFQTVVYIISSRNDFEEIELREIANLISEEGGELFMTLGDRIRAEGMQIGRQEGIRSGLEQVARNLLKEGMEMALVIKTTGLSKTEVEKIKKELDKYIDK